VSEEASKVKQAPDLKDVVLRFYQAVSDGNVEGFDQFISQRAPMTFIGTDPTEWWTETDSIREMLRQQAAMGVTVEPGEISAYREGTVGWTANKGDFLLPDGQRMPFRLTAVFHLEDGAWKLVQEHASFGVGNEEALGVDLAG
jgi:ketosteroid isomerase-like protein